MNKVHLTKIPVATQNSPRRRFSVTRQHISLALGGVKDAGPGGGGHPFDVELTRVPTGCAAWPLHAHSAQWELYVIVSGRGEARTGEETVQVGPGDCFIHPPGEAHQLRNIGEEDLVYYVVADNAPTDVIYYPESDKWFIKPHRKCFRMEETEYFEGED